MSRFPLDVMATVEVIREGFILPLIPLKPDNMTEEFFIEEQIFHYSERLIQDFYAVEPFKMKGNLWLSPNKKVAGLKQRNIQSGTEFCVRRDATIPDAIDVEITRGAGKDTGNVYTLTTKEWQSIRPNLYRKFSQDRSTDGGHLIKPDRCTHMFPSNQRCRKPVWQNTMCELHLKRKWAREGARRRAKAKKLQKLAEEQKGKKK